MQETKFSFLKAGKWIGVGSLVVIITLWSITFARGGFNIGVDFSAGLSLTVLIDGQTQVDVVEVALADISKVKVVDVGDRGIFRISVPENESDPDFQRVMEARIMAELMNSFGQAQVLSSEFVGSSFSAGTTRGAINAIVGSILLILLYLWFRFHGIYFSLATLLGTFHDVLIVVGVIGAFQLEVSSATIAAVLAIIAYSLNDTIVIFDRVRENMQAVRFAGIEATIDGSLMQTLKRTVITSFTTLLAIGALIITTNGTVQLFAIKMFVGIIVGNYSSLFVASWLLFKFITHAQMVKKKHSVKSKSVPAN